MGRGRRRKGRPVNGWVLLDKPVGLTSTAAVARVRALFEAQKAGHAGTLNPLASGVLPLALGEATKVVSYVMASTKAYRFTVRWGEERDTDDAEGAAVARSDKRPERAEIEARLSDFEGEILQIPPAYSAIKVKGERAYDMARDGRPADLPARPVRIESFELIGCPDRDHAEFRLRCGKGAYVRALARDLGRALGCFGYVSGLRRTAVGGFDEGHAISLEMLEELGHKGALESALRPVEAALDDIPALALTENEADRLKCGQSLRVPSSKEGTVYATCRDRLVAIAYLERGEIKPVRVFNL